MTDGNEDVSRRAFLRTATGVTAAAAATGTAAAQENESEGEGSGESSGDSGGGSTETVTVGPGGDLVFDPESLEIEAGTTVEFVWDSDTHNIVVDSQPEEADWGGTEGGPSDIYNTGHTHTHTFDALGTYDYYCAPHETAGMVASIDVVESLSTPSGSNLPQVPQSAKALGVATSVVMVTTLGLAFFFLKYGGDYEPPEE